MTYREYLENCDDEWEKTIIVANLARKHPDYDRYSPRRKKETLKELLDAEMPVAKEGIKFADEIVEEINERRPISVPDDCMTGEAYEEWLRR